MIQVGNVRYLVQNIKPNIIMAEDVSSKAWAMVVYEHDPWPNNNNEIDHISIKSVQ